MLPDVAAPAEKPPRSALRALLALLTPRPAEWVVLGWFAVVAAMLLLRGARDAYPGLPRGDILAFAFAVLVFKLAHAYFATPWSDPESRQALLFPVTVLFAVIPTGEVVFDQLARIPTDLPVAFSDGGFAATWLLAGRAVLVRLASGLLPMVLWFALGLHLKRHGRLRPRALLDDDGAAALDYVRGLAAPILLILSYPLVGDLMSRPLFADRDGLMQRFDRALFWGHDPSHALEHVISPWLSEAMAFSYTFYALLLPLVFAAVIAFGSRRALAEASFVLCAGFAAGYVMYLLVPVRGPMAAETFKVPLDFYWFGDVKEALMDRYRVARDCFPSLHTAVSLLSLWQLHRHARKVFWVALPLAAPIPFACVYLRYHYVADVLAGTLLAVLVALAARRLAPRFA